MGEKQEIIDPWRTALCELFVVDWFWGAWLLGRWPRPSAVSIHRWSSNCVLHKGLLLYIVEFLLPSVFFKAVQKKKKKNKEKKQ